MLLVKNNGSVVTLNVVMKTLTLDSFFAGARTRVRPRAPWVIHTSKLRLKKVVLTYPLEGVAEGRGYEQGGWVKYAIILIMSGAGYLKYIGGKRVFRAYSRSARRARRGGVDKYACFFCAQEYARRRELARHYADLNSECYKTAFRIVSYESRFCS